VWCYPWTILGVLLASVGFLIARDQRHQAQLVYTGLDRDQLPGLFVGGKEEGCPQFGPNILILKEAKAEYAKLQ
jgi:hypothetical protein